MIEKVSKEQRSLIQLFRPMLGQVSEQVFAERFMGQMKRLSVRSTGTLPVIKEIYEMIGCDFSEFIEDIAFPTLVEYLYQGETFNETIEIFKVLLKKCRSIAGFVKQLVQIRNINESQSLALLRLVAIVPQSDFSQDILEFAIGISQKIKAEGSKGMVASSISHLVTDKNIPVDFLKANVMNSAFANIISAHGAKPNLNYNQTTPLSVVSLISIQYPDPAPAKITQFVTESSSVLFSLQNLNEDDALARALVNALKYHPGNINLLKKFSKSVVSPYSEVRRFCLENWPAGPIDTILGFLKENICEETALVALTQVIDKLSWVVTQRFEKSEDIHAYLALVTSQELCTRKRIRFILKKFGEKLENYNRNVFFSTPECAGLALSLQNFEEKSQILLPEIDFDSIISAKKTLEYVQQVFDDPNFDDFGKFNKMCRELLKSAEIQSDSLDSATVYKSLDIIWNRSIVRVKFILQSFILSLKFRSLTNSTPIFFDFLCKKILKHVLKLTSIPDLQGITWDFLYRLTCFSPSFNQISWYFTTALFKSSHNQWSDKALSKLFKFTENNLSIARIESSEAYLLERVVLWVLRQSGTSLRATALGILIDYLHCAKFSCLSETITEICALIESYSSPLLNSLFQPLLEILEPADWEPFLNILLNLQPNTKQIVLDSLLQYNKDLPGGEHWLVTPVYLCTFDDIDMVSSSAAEVWEKSALVLRLDTLLEHVMQHLFSPNLELALMTAQALKSAIVKHPEWTAEIVHKLQRDVVGQTHKLGFVKFLEIVCDGVPKNLVLGMEEFLLDAGMMFNDVRKELLQIAILYLNTHGEVLLNEFFAMLQLRINHLNENIRNSAVVLIGYLARFFNSEDFRIESTIDLLLKSLDMPSDLLFSTVSKFLPRLVSFRQHLVDPLLQQEFRKLIDTKPINVRRGAGYGLGCLVKGGGLKSLVTYNILDKLEQIINNKKSGDVERGGVLIAIEGLGAVLGRGFEPYLGEVLPFIIDCFANRELQEQAAISTKVMISKLSAHGMKRILPQLTHGLEETKWRSKVGAIEALGKWLFVPRSSFRQPGPISCPR